MPDYTPTAVSAAEAECREFVAEFPTRNVLRAVALCEDGTLSWEACRALFNRALTEGLRSVTA